MLKQGITAILIFAASNVQGSILSPTVLSSSLLHAGEGFSMSCGPKHFTNKTDSKDVHYDTIVLFRSLQSHPFDMLIACYYPNSPNESTQVIPRGRRWTIDLPDHKGAGQIVVSVNHAHCSDSGLYRCSLYNGAETLDQIERLVVRNKIFQPPIIMASSGGEKLKVEDNVEGDKVTLICTVKGDENLDMKWKFRDAHSRSTLSHLYPHAHHISRPISYAYRRTGGNCILFRHESHLTITLHKSHEAYFLMCVVTADDVEVSSRSFHVTFPTSEETTMYPSSPFTQTNVARRLEFQVTSCLLSHVMLIFLECRV